MPTYEYKCQNCGHTLELLQKITDQPLIECPRCHQPKLQKGVGGGIGLAFKGSGFYITDYTPRVESSEVKPESKPENKVKECCPCGKNACEK